MKLSRETKKILKQKKGYRCDTSVSSRYHGPQPLFETLYSEVIELGNTHVTRDICKSLNIKGVACKLKDVDADEYGIDSSILEDLVEKVSKKTGVKKPKVLWLATKKEAKQFYCHGDEPTEYKLSKNIIVLSDLGSDGVLLLDKKWNKK